MRVLALILIGLSVTSAAFARELFQVVNSSFSDDFDPREHRAIREFENGAVNAANITNNEIWFSCAIVGDYSAIQHLREFRHLRCGVLLWKGNVLRDTIEIGLSQKDWIRDRNGLQGEVEKGGVFSWRTFCVFGVTDENGEYYDRIEIFLRDRNDAPITIKRKFFGLIGDDKKIELKIRKS